ncbi:MAG: NAD(P)/FAD-dependent oxidoreductase [Xanthobacteraceae bacterium]
MAESVYGPTWYAATAVAAPERSRLVYDVDVDACVIGAGLAGLTVARELARRGWSVALLEANRVAWNASSRNAGFVAPGFAERLDRIVERVGLERTRELWVLSAGGVDYIRSTIRETAMAGVSPVDGRLTVQRFDSEERLFAQADLIAGKLGTEVEAWSTEQVREVLKSKAYFQGLHLPGGFHIHPLNYALGLAAAAEEAGAKIFEQTRALEIDAAGVRKRITTAAGRVRANHIVLAGNAHLGSLCPEVSNSILPVASYVATTAPLGERLLDAITYSGAVSDTRRTGDHYRIIDGDRLLWGGRLAAHLNSPRRLKNVMRRDILTIFPQLGDVEITHAWSGLMGYAVHKMPQIGEVSPGLWVASAFGSHGLNTSAMAGELIARAIAEGDDRWRLFSSYDLVHAGGRVGRAAAQVLYGAMRIRDAIDEQLASQRAVARRRKEAFAARAAGEAKRRVAEEAARLAVEEAQRRAAAAAERIVAAEAVARATQEAEHAAAEESRQQAAYMAAQAEQRRVVDEITQRAALASQEASRREWTDQLAAANPQHRRVSDAAPGQIAREAAERAGRIAAEEAAHRIAQEAARLTGPRNTPGEPIEVTPGASASVPGAWREVPEPDVDLARSAMAALAQQGKAAAPKRKRRRDGAASADIARSPRPED